MFLFLVVNLHDVINTHKTEFQTQEYFIIAIATSMHDIIVIQNVWCLKKQQQAISEACSFSILYYCVVLHCFNDMNKGNVQYSGL